MTIKKTAVITAAVALTAIFMGRASAQEITPVGPVEIELNASTPNPLELVYTDSVFSNTEGNPSINIYSNWEETYDGDIKLTLKNSLLEADEYQSISIQNLGKGKLTVNFDDYTMIKGTVRLENGGGADIRNSSFISGSGSGYDLAMGGDTEFFNEGGVDVSSNALSFMRNSNVESSSGKLTVTNYGLLKAKSQNAVHLVEGSTFHLENYGEINMDHIIPARSAGIGTRGLAEKIALNIGFDWEGGTIINNGRILSSQIAIRINAKNVTLDLREYSHIEGGVDMGSDGGNTLILNSYGHGITGYFIMASPELVPYATRDALGNHVFKLTINSEYEYGNMWVQMYADITNAVLDVTVDILGEDIASGTTFTILEANEGITGSFYGLEDGDVYTARGGHSFIIHYSAEAVTLEYLGLVPEPAAAAVFAAALAAACLAFRRRKN